MQKALELLQDKKIKYGLIGALILIFIIVMVISMSGNKEEKPIEPTGPQNIEINEELKKDITKKIALLKYNQYCDIPVAGDKFAYDCLYRKQKTTASELNDIYRIYTLTLSMDEQMEEKNNYIVGRIIVDNLVFEHTQTFTLEELHNEYNKLYGKVDYLTPKVVNAISAFPYVKYDETRKKIFYQTKGVEVEENTNHIVEYINKFESDENNIYVYLNVAFLSERAFQEYGIYTDRTKQVEIGTKEFKGYNKNEVINDTNNEQLPTYKYTFTKEENTGNLIFTQVELVQ